MNEKKLEEYDEVFDFISGVHPDWERLVMEDNVKVKTNQDTVQFVHMEQIMRKFSIRITDISYSDYYGIFFGIEKLTTV